MYIYLYAHNFLVLNILKVLAMKFYNFNQCRIIDVLERMIKEN